MTRIALRWLATIWILALIGGSLMPGQAKLVLGTTTSRPVGDRPPNLEHRVVHCVGFGIAELLLLLLTTNRRQEVYRVIGVISLGFGLELTQHFILSGRYFEWWDLRDDAIGIFAALLIVDITRARKWICT
jgi:hypothetical protein